MSLRESAARLAHERPDLRAALVPVLKKAGWDDPPSPERDMAGFMEWLEKRLMTPYPSIENALGFSVRDNALKSQTVVTPTKGTIIFTHAPNVEIRVTVTPPKTISVTGEIRGQKLHKDFGYRPSVSGIHRGVIGDILDYIEDNQPTEVIYKVYDDPPRAFKTVQELTRAYKQIATTPMGGSRKKELQGLPMLDGFAGPMYDGREGTRVVVRYDTWANHEMLTR